MVKETETTINLCKKGTKTTINCLFPDCTWQKGKERSSIVNQGDTAKSKNNNPPLSTNGCDDFWHPNASWSQAKSRDNNHLCQR